MSERLFVHKAAFTDVKTNFLYHDEVVKLIPKIINSKGVLNIWWKIQSIYDFARLSKNNVKKAEVKKFWKKIF